MKRIVVDASVVAAAFFRENRTHAARAVMLSMAGLLAPDLVYSEVANVIWKRRRKAEIDAEEAVDLLNDVFDIPLEIASSEKLVRPALALAMATGRTVYDCIYMALAVQERTVLVSDDRRLVNALNGGPLQDHVVWLGDEKWQ